MTNIKRTTETNHYLTSEDLGITIHSNGKISVYLRFPDIASDGMSVVHCDSALLPQIRDLCTAALEELDQ